MQILQILQIYVQGRGMADQPPFHSRWLFEWADLISYRCSYSSRSCQFFWTWRNFVLWRVVKQVRWESSALQQHVDFIFILLTCIRPFKHSIRSWLRTYYVGAHCVSTSDALALPWPWVWSQRGPCLRGNDMPLPLQTTFVELFISASLVWATQMTLARSFSSNGLIAVCTPVTCRSE